MSVQENKATVRRLIDIQNARDLARLDEVVDEQMVYRTGSGEEYRGRETHKEAIRQSYEAFPDLAFSIEEMMAEGDKVHMIYVLTGTHEGHHLDLPPSHNTMVHPASSILTLRDGKVIEQRDFYDSLHFRKQLGADSEDVRQDGGQ